MTPPMTPREKVELKPCPFCGGDAVAGSNFDNDHYVMCGADCDKCGGMVGYMKTEMAAIENWNRRTALASSSGDHAELAGKLRSRTDSIVETPLGPFRSSKGRLRNPDGPKAADAIEALLAENAALQAERDRAKDRMHKAIDKARDEEIAAQNAELRATEAERKLAEARLNYEGALSDIDSLLTVLIRRINGEKDLASAAEWVRLNYPLAAEKILSKEAERG